ncbi:MAG: hypothetical protein KatS3mg014_2580 [Actinomycetota bacterium]|nr:MAG: hypothetical protein KatS3mg014_2580 [Actinomycetota bacterium]
MSLSFSAALDGFEARIEAIERALETGRWEDVPAWVPPAEPPSGCGPGDVERLTRLLARAEACRLRLLAALGDAVEGVRAGRAAARAARGYLSAPR